jgi:hypothetical protein
MVQTEISGNISGHDTTVIEIEKLRVEYKEQIIKLTVCCLRFSPFPLAVTSLFLVQNENNLLKEQMLKDGNLKRTMGLEIAALKAELESKSVRAPFFSFLNFWLFFFHLFLAF